MTLLSGIIFRLIPGTFHGFFSALGLLLISVGIIYNVLGNFVLEFINNGAGSPVESGVPAILTGIFFICIGIMIYFVKVILY